MPRESVVDKTQITPPNPEKVCGRIEFIYILQMHSRDCGLSDPYLFCFVRIPNNFVILS